MRKSIIILLSCFLTVFTGFSQQVGLFNQYQTLPGVLNPAAIGLDDKINLDIGYHKQWMGFESTPMSYFVSTNTLLGASKGKSYSNLSMRVSNPGKYKELFKTKETKFRMAVGGLIMIENYGSIKKTSENVALCLKTKLKDKYNLSAGFSTGILDFSVDKSKITLIDPQDPTYDEFISFNESQYYLDMNFGLWLFTEKYNFGYAAKQLLGNSISFGGNTISKISVHHILQASFNYQKSEKLMLYPGFMLRYVKNQPLSWDLIVRGEYLQKYWAGVIYRNNQSAVIMAGLTYDQYKIGYSMGYDYGSLIRPNSTSHELTLGMLF